MKNIKTALIASSLVLLSACSATQNIPGAQHIELVNEAPDRSQCQYVGEIVGSQGNWLTGDFTSNENLAVGARNELRNRAHRMGANLVYIQDMKNTNAHGSLGTTNTTAIGKAYKCKF